MAVCRDVPPKTLQTVEAADMTKENMHDDTEVVKDYPLSRLGTLNVMRSLSHLTQALLDRFGNPPGMLGCVCGGQHEVVCQDAGVSEIKYYDILGHSLQRQFCGGGGEGACSIHFSGTTPGKKQR